MNENKFYICVSQIYNTMNHLLRILVLVVVIAQTDFLCGQTFSVMRKYDVKTGLSDNTVRTIMQAQPDIYGWGREMG